MKNLKEILTCIMAATVCASLCACDNEDEIASKAADVASQIEAKLTTAPAETTAVSTSVTTTAKTTTAKVTTTKAKTTAATTTAAEEVTEPEYIITEPEPETEAPTEAAPSGGYIDGSDLYVYYGGGSFTVNQDISTCPAASSVDSSPSCYYEGDDKIFHYGDIDVYTYPSGGADYILEINLLSGGASTARGLSVGMSINDAIAMYGQPDSSGGMYSWYCGSSYIYATESGGTITSIGIAAN